MVAITTYSFLRRYIYFVAVSAIAAMTLGEFPAYNIVAGATVEQHDASKSASSSLRRAKEGPLRRKLDASFNVDGYNDENDSPRTESEREEVVDGYEEATNIESIDVGTPVTTLTSVEDIHVQPITPNPPPTPTCTSSTPSSDLVSLSRSYIIDSTYPNFLRPSKVIFDYRCSNDVVVSREQFSDTSDRTYTSSIEIEDKLKVGFGLSVKDPSGGFEVAASFSTSKISTSSNKYTRVDHTIAAATKQVMSNELYPHRRLTPAAKQYLLEESPANILHYIGPYYATSLKLGASFQLSTVGITSNSTESFDFQNNVTADVNLLISASLHQETDLSKSNIDNCTEYKTDYTSRGGNSHIWLSRSKSVKEMIEEWKNSITDDNQYPIEQTLEPIWTLLDHEEMNPRKADEVKIYIQDVWKTEHDEVSAAEGQMQYRLNRKREKTVVGDVTIMQPSEELGQYMDRSITKSACALMKGSNDKGDGIWNLDYLYCNDGSRCLKWGEHCYAGRIVLPEGLSVLTYRDFGSEQRKTEFHGSPPGTVVHNYWNYDDRTCSFKFSVEPGFTCGTTRKCG